MVGFVGDAHHVIAPPRPITSEGRELVHRMEQARHLVVHKIFLLEQLWLLFFQGESEIESGSLARL